MKSLKVLCDGGLANRLGHLVQAIYFSELFGCTLEISWPVNNWCGAEFHDLISPAKWSEEINSLSLSHIIKSAEPSDILICHENQLPGFPGSVVRSTDLTAKVFFFYLNSRPSTSVYFYGNSCLPFLNHYDRIRSSSMISFQSQILKRLHGFKESLDIDLNECVGIHIRGTDFGAPVNQCKEALQFMLSNASTFFFLSSDESEVEKSFSSIPNCVVREKNSYCARLDPSQGWNGAITDCDGREFRFNVNRSGQSVIEALIDMLCLSRCKRRIKSSSSTFLEFSELLSFNDNL